VSDTGGKWGVKPEGDGATLKGEGVRWEERKEGERYIASSIKDENTTKLTAEM